MPQEGQARTAKNAGSTMVLNAVALSIRMRSPGRIEGRHSSGTVFKLVAGGFRSIMGRRNDGFVRRRFRFFGWRFRVILTPSRCLPFFDSLGVAACEALPVVFPTLFLFWRFLAPSCHAA
jgi:hypothetical protein